MYQKTLAHWYFYTTKDNNKAIYPLQGQRILSGKIIILSGKGTDWHALGSTYES